MVESFREYLTGVPADVALLLSHFRVSDVALRVVGVGSVGTRCYLVILTGPDGTPLILQVKEATRSVLEQYGKVLRRPTAPCRFRMPNSRYDVASMVRRDVRHDGPLSHPPSAPRAKARRSPGVLNRSRPAHSDPGDSYRAHSDSTSVSVACR